VTTDLVLVIVISDVLVAVSNWSIIVVIVSADNVADSRDVERLKGPALANTFWVQPSKS
jgi:hypothetical protein